MISIWTSVLWMDTRYSCRLRHKVKRNFPWKDSSKLTFTTLPNDSNSFAFFCSLNNSRLLLVIDNKTHSVQFSKAALYFFLPGFTKANACNLFTCISSQKSSNVLILQFNKVPIRLHKNKPEISYWNGILPHALEPYLGFYQTSKPCGLRSFEIHWTQVISFVTVYEFGETQGKVTKSQSMR